MTVLKVIVLIIALNMFCCAAKQHCADLYGSQITTRILDPRSRILDGEPGSAAKYPFVVRVWAKHRGSKIMVGSGIIVSEWHIVTSAHIITVHDTGKLNHRYYSPSVNVTIAPGGNTEKTVGVDLLVTKGNFIETTDRRDDIAVLKLKEKLTFSPEVKMAFLSALLPKQSTAILAAIGCTRSVDSGIRECRMMNPSGTPSSPLQYPSPNDDDDGEIFIEDESYYSAPDEIFPDDEDEIPLIENHGSKLFLPAQVRSYTVKLGTRLLCLRRKVPYQLLCGGTSDPQGQHGDSGGALVIYDTNGYAYLYGIYAGTRRPIGPGHLEFVSIAYACEWFRSVTDNKVKCRIPDRVIMPECTP